MRRYAEYAIGFVIYVALTVLILTPLVHSLDNQDAARRARAVQRTSDVHTCQGVNLTHAGVAKFVAQLQAVAAAEKLTPRERQRSNAELAGLLADFPTLDCTATPIQFVSTGQKGHS